MLLFSKNMVQKMTVIVIEIIFLVFFSGCSKEDVAKVITKLPPVNTDNNLAVGASARDFLSAANFSSVTIEIQYVDGFQPKIESIDNFIGYLNELLHKSGGIRYSLRPVVSPLKNELTLNDIAIIEKNNRTVFTSGTCLGVYILFTDGYYYQGNIIGLSYRNTSMCFLGKSIYDNSGRTGQASRVTLETSIMQHEFGHLLGLVGMGSPMQVNHQDYAHYSHCNNSNCLMFYALGSPEFLNNLLPNSIPVLDNNCRADLKANGGR